MPEIGFHEFHSIKGNVIDINLLFQTALDRVICVTKNAGELNGEKIVLDKGTHSEIDYLYDGVPMCF